MGRSKNPDLQVTLEQARALWHAKQGLAAPAADDPAGAVGRTGWARTLGGVDVYFAVRARCPGLRRAGLEDAVARGDLRVVPAVRGCIYLVPEPDVPLVMALAADLSRPRTERDLEKAGSSWEEVEALAREVMDVVAGGAKTTAEIRQALPPGAARSLGAAGKKVGLSSPLPVALRELEFRGAVERRPAGARLDTERYEWSAAATPLSQKFPIPAEPADRLAAVIRRYLEFFGPATLREISGWIGVSQRDAKAAMATLELCEVAIEGHAPSAWIHAADREALAAARPESEIRPGSESLSFLAFEDNYLTVHGGPGVLTDPVHHEVPMDSWGSSKPSTLGAARHVSSRTLVAGGKVAGFWEMDLDAGRVVAATLDDWPKPRRDVLEEACEGLGAFVRDELGHARSFSLDTDDAVRRRAAAVGEMA